MHSEMELVRQMLRQNFGDAAVSQGNDILNKLFEEQKREGWQQFKQTVRQCCSQTTRSACSCSTSSSWWPRPTAPYRRARLPP